MFNPSADVNFPPKYANFNLSFKEINNVLLFPAGNDRLRGIDGSGASSQTFTDRFDQTLNKFRMPAVQINF